MPVYEFRCNACGAGVSLFTRSISAPVTGACERCGSTDLRRLISRFAVLRGDDFSGDFDDLPDMDDPKALARWARQMRSELGEEAGYDLEEQIERLERGEPMNEDRLEDLASYTDTDLHDH
jgi:putative FmdB family regulatory protein